MKKLILFAAILFAGVSVVNAQTAKTDITSNGGPTEFDHTYVNSDEDKVANTLLTVELNTIQAISINTSNVSLKYTDITDYTNGVSNTIDKHLNVYSTGGYDVYVHYVTLSEGSSYSNTDLDAASLFNSINVVAEGQEGTTLTTTETTNKVITSATGAINKPYKVTYTGAGTNNFDADSGNGYMNYIKGDAPNTLTANVYYTITTN